MSDRIENPGSVPAGEYQRRLIAQQTLLKSSEKREETIANLRLGVFVLGLAWAVYAWWYHPLWLSGLVVPVVLFLCLMAVHERTRRTLERTRGLVAFYESGTARLEGKWAMHGDTGDEFLRDDHPYAADLDLFGKASLFQLICRASTRSGAAALASWLLRAEKRDVVLARQAAVEELRNRLELREELALQGHKIRQKVHPESLERWVESAPVFESALLQRLAWGLAALSMAALVLWLLTQVAWPVLVMLCVDMTVLSVASGRMKALTQSLEEPRRELRVLAGVLARFEEERFESPMLLALQSRLHDGGVPASVAIQRLDRLSYLFELQANQLFAPVAILLLWGIHVAARLEAWKTRWAVQVPGWIQAVGEMEAVSALACFAYEHPDYPFPELTDEGARLEMSDGGHPLLATGHCVRNSLCLDATQPMLIVSGSNMSGKSTLLRTAGINAVLALAGAPVCAKRFVLSELTLGATMRVHDSIQSGESRFYAEVKRLGQIMEKTEVKPPVLFLLDELLHGTNSQDRTIGGAAILRRFLERGAIGMVTTHDLSLSVIADELPGVRNVHFEDQVSEKGLSFDYLLRDGIVRKSNALEIMRRAGLDV